MRIAQLVFAAALAVGLGGAASATPAAPTAGEVIAQPGVTLEYAKRKGHKGWKDHRGGHYGWYRGRHRGWYKPHRRVYYVPRRHYGWHHRPAYYAYRPRYHYYGHYPRRRGITINF